MRLLTCPLLLLCPTLFLLFQTLSLFLQAGRNAHCNAATARNTMPMKTQMENVTAACGKRRKCFLQTEPACAEKQNVLLVLNAVHV